MFISVIHLLLILHCGYLVSTEHVLQWIPDGKSIQFTYDFHTKERLVQTTSHEVKSPSGEPFKIVCGVYNDQNAKADIYTKEGVIIETLGLQDKDTNACKESNLEHYIEPQDREDGKVKIVYMMKGTPPTCKSRTYDIKVLSFMALVNRTDLERDDPVPCSDKVKQFIKGFQKPEEAGGVVKVTPCQAPNDVFDFTNHLVTRGTPETIDFPEKDLKDKKFGLICREDTLSVEDPLTKKDKIIIGALTNENFWEGEPPSIYTKVLDRFQLTACDVSFININRRVVNGKSFYKAVFNTAEGICYERTYVYDLTVYWGFYIELEWDRTSKKVTCPEKFTGDIQLNAHTLECDADTPFSVEMFYGKVLKQKMAYLAEHNVPD